MGNWLLATVSVALGVIVVMVRVRNAKLEKSLALVTFDKNVTVAINEQRNCVLTAIGSMVEIAMRRMLATPFWGVSAVARDNKGNIIAATISRGIAAVGGQVVLGHNDPHSHNWASEMDDFVGKSATILRIREGSEYVDGRVKRLFARVDIDGGVFDWEVDAMSAVSCS